MAEHANRTAPRRSEKHQALRVFLGEWRASGLSFGAPDQTKVEPRGKPTPWTSTHTGRWHAGEFFLIQDERATVDGPFDTLSIMGWDEDAGRYFARSFENHGFYRHYQVHRDGRVWTFSGDSERARVEFSEDGSTQTLAWEWLTADGWLPLCDRVATKVP